MLGYLKTFTAAEPTIVAELIDHDGMRLKQSGVIRGGYQYVHLENTNLEYLLAERRRRRSIAASNLNKNAAVFRGPVVCEESTV